MTMTLPGGIAELAAAVMLLGASPEAAIDDMKAFDNAEMPYVIVDGATTSPMTEAVTSTLVTLSAHSLSTESFVLTGIDLDGAGHARLVSADTDANAITHTSPNGRNDQPIFIAVHGLDPLSTHFALTLHFDGQPSVIVPVKR